MIQTVLGVFLILLHIVCCVLVWLGIKTHLLKVKKYLMALVIFVPFWGTVCVLLLHLQMLTRKDNRMEPGVEKLRVNEEIYKNIFQAVSDTDKKIVPLEEALLINEPRVRRELIMDVLNDDPEEYMDLLKQARMNEDVEVVHYAITAMVELSKEYDFRLERRNEYLTKYKPMENVTLFTEELLKQGYYYALLSYGNQCQFKRKKEMDRYHKLLPAINKLYNKGILSARLYDIADEVERYIAYGITYKDKKNPSVEEIMSAVGENELNQYIYTKMAVGSLNANDTLALTTRHTQFDSIVKMPHLRAQVMQIYNQTKSYLENPQPVSNNLLYGEFHENSKLKTSMPYMEPVYNILEKNHGKVIYFDFWARWCPPCLAEMEPLKQLRSKYSTKDLVIYSICVSEPKEEWEECLNEYSLKNRGIECIYASDYFGKDNLQKIRKQWKIDRMPYYLLINRKGQIVDFGTTVCPSNPQFVSRIEEAVKDSK